MRRGRKKKRIGNEAYSLPSPASRLIALRLSERSSGEANALLPSVKYGVETLKERIAVNKIEPLSYVNRPNVVHDKVYASLLAADKLVERAGPDLRIRCEFERPAADSEEERLEVGVLRRGNSKKLRGRVEDCARSTAVAFERIYKEEGAFQAIDLYRTDIKA